MSVETAVFSHLKAHNATNHARFSYWKDPKNKELDLVIEISDDLIPLEVKYESQIVTARDVQGLINFCKEKQTIPFGYVLTKTAQDIGLLEINNKLPSTQIMRIPAAIFCYWLGESEIVGKSILVYENSKGLDSNN
jgi:predicted AAA+ superfamily ATPase